MKEQKKKLENSFEDLKSEKELMMVKFETERTEWEHSTDLLKNGKMRCILCVFPYLLLDRSADLHETFRAYKVQPQLMQEALFNFRSKPWNRIL